jgi:hypothetical protein
MRPSILFICVVTVMMMMMIDDDLVERPSTHAGLSGLLTPTTPGWNAPPPVCHRPLSSGAM